MALRELLSSSQREALEAISVDRAGLIEHYVLSDQDLSLVRRRRGAQNRLGLAVQLAFLRFPGRALLPNESPPAELLNFLARQLGLSAGAWESYTLGGVHIYFPGDLPLRVFKSAQLWASRFWLKHVLSWGPLPELGKASLQVFSSHVIFVFIGLALIYEDAGEQVEGWEAKLLVFGTMIGQFSIALLWKRRKQEVTVAKP